MWDYRGLRGAECQWLSTAEFPSSMIDSHGWLATRMVHWGNTARVLLYPLLT